VTDPTDLSAIGVAVSRFCKHWDETGGEITVCFDSLDALLRHSSPKEVFQFAHVLTNRLSSVDAYAHFHFDPTRHEDRVVSTFGTVFDAVVADDDTDEVAPGSDRRGRRRVTGRVGRGVDDRHRIRCGHRSDRRGHRTSSRKLRRTIVATETNYTLLTTRSVIKCVSTFSGYWALSASSGAPAIRQTGAPVHRYSSPYARRFDADQRGSRNEGDTEQRERQHEQRARNAADRDDCNR